MTAPTPSNPDPPRMVVTLDRTRWERALLVHRWGPPTSVLEAVGPSDQMSLQVPLQVAWFAPSAQRHAHLMCTSGAVQEEAPGWSHAELMMALKGPLSRAHAYQAAFILCALATHGIVSGEAVRNGSVVPAGSELSHLGTQMNHLLVVWPSQLADWEPPTWDGATLDLLQAVPVHAQEVVCARHAGLGTLLRLLRQTDFTDLARAPTVME